jgi:hypothetical protein
VLLSPYLFLTTLLTLPIILLVPFSPVLSFMPDYKSSFRSPVIFHIRQSLCQDSKSRDFFTYHIYFSAQIITTCSFNPVINNQIQKVIYTQKAIYSLFIGSLMVSLKSFFANSS